MIEFQVSAPGKLILYGEHAVVYGKTAIAASIDLRTRLELKELPINTDRIIISMPKISLDITIPIRCIFENCLAKNPKFSPDVRNIILTNVANFVTEEVDCTSSEQKSALEAFFYLLIIVSDKEKLKLRPVKIVIDGELSISSGLGSSASYSVCLAAAFVNWSNGQNNRRTVMNEGQLEIISNYAHECERIMHGNPSGIDNTICTHGAFIEFRRGDKLELIHEPIGMRVLLVDTKIQRSTKKLVEQFRGLVNRNSSIYQPILDSIDGISRQAIAIVKRMRDIGNEDKDLLGEAYKELMELTELNQKLLAACQLSHLSLDKICEVAKVHGLAGKLTGAGGGGYAYILLTPYIKEAVIDAVMEILDANGYYVILTKLGAAGVEISEN